VQQSATCDQVDARFILFTLFANGGCAIVQRPTPLRLDCEGKLHGYAYWDGDNALVSGDPMEGRRPLCVASVQSLALETRTAYSIRHQAGGGMTLGGSSSLAGVAPTVVAGEVPGSPAATWRNGRDSMWTPACACATKRTSGHSTRCGLRVGQHSC